VLFQSYCGLTGATTGIVIAFNDNLDDMNDRGIARPGPLCSSQRNPCPGQDQRSTRTLSLTTAAKVRMHSGGYPAAPGRSSAACSEPHRADEDSAASRAIGADVLPGVVGRRRCGCGPATTSTPPTAAVSVILAGEPGVGKHIVKASPRRNPTGCTSRCCHRHGRCAHRSPRASTTRWTRCDPQTRLDEARHNAGRRR